MIVLIVVIIISITLLVWHQKRKNAICMSKSRLDGKTVIVTGGTTGMGLEIATDFAKRGARVIIACPFENEGAYARKCIIEKTGNDNIHFKLLDLASLESVRIFAATIIKTETRLNILVNNAGVGVPQNFITQDGLNFVMQVNYLGHFLLTILLLPLLKTSGNSSDPIRIVNVSSGLHWYAKLDLNNLNAIGKSLVERIQIYGNSKLCLILFSRELTKKLVGFNVVINNAVPGTVGTRIFESSSVVLGWILRPLCYILLKTPWEGAQTAIHVAVDVKAGEVSGQVFENCKLFTSSRAAKDSTTALKVWEESIRLVKLSSSELNACLGSI